MNAPTVPVDVLAEIAWIRQWAIDTTPQGGEAVFGTAEAVGLAVAELIEDRRLLAEALSAVITMEVRGHQMQDRLQFSDTGRAILTKIDSARDAMSAALARIGQPS